VASNQTILDVKFTVEMVPMAMDIIALVNAAPDSVLTQEKRQAMLDFLIPLSAKVVAKKEKFVHISIEESNRCQRTMDEQ